MFLRSLLLACLLCQAPFALSCQFVMGYRMTARLPNINEYPNNSGLYSDLYKKAAEMIGCKLKIERLSKKRVLLYIEEGVIDFYPGLTFTVERSDYIYFFDNGLPSLDVGLSQKGLFEIRSYHDLHEKSILIPLGAPNTPIPVPQGVSSYKDLGAYQIDVISPSALTFERAIDIILKGRADIYVDDIGTLNYYLQTHPERHKLKYHADCCGGVKYLTAGFSRASEHYEEEVNPEFDNSLELSAGNVPYKMKEKTKAHDFYLALMELKQQGFTDRLFQKYYGIDVNNLDLLQTNQ